VKLARDIRTMVGKELRTEWRTHELVTAMGVLGVLVLIVFAFSFPPGTVSFQRLAPGILWVAFVFAGILGMNRAMAQEREEGCLQGLLLTPVDRGAVYLGKMITNLLFLLAIEALIVALCILFFNVSFAQGLGLFILVTFLGSVGYVAVGTLFSAIAAQTRFQEVLLPVLLIPLAAPILVAVVKCTGAVLEGGGFSAIAFWVKFLIAFDAVFIIGSFLVFEYVVQE